MATWTKQSIEALSEASWENIVDWVKDQGRGTTDSAKQLFRYLTGDPVVERQTGLPRSVGAETRVKEVKKVEEDKSVWGSITGLFGSLRGTSQGGIDEGRADTASGRLWQEGEVHAELIRVSQENRSPGFPELTFEHASE